MSIPWKPDWSWRHGWKPTPANVAFARKLRDFLYATKNRPCADCGNSYIQNFGHRMTFDHLKRRGPKLFDIGGIGVSETGELGYRLVPIEVLLEEIRKCQVVCGPCHSRREKWRDERRWKFLVQAPVVATLFSVLKAAYRLEQDDLAAAGVALDAALFSLRCLEAEPWILIGKSFSRAYNKAISKLTPQPSRRAAQKNLSKFASDVVSGCLYQAGRASAAFEVLSVLSGAGQRSDL